MPNGASGEDFFLNTNHMVVLLILSYNAIHNKDDATHNELQYNNGSFIKKVSIGIFSIIKTTLNKKFFAAETADKVLSLSEI